MNKNSWYKLFDTHPGIIVTCLLTLVIGVFLLLIAPWHSNSPQSTPTPSPTPNLSQVATLRGHVSVTCSDSQTECKADMVLSAYDIAAYAAGKPDTAVGQVPIDEFGDYVLTLPPGSYVVQTVPANQAQAIDVMLTAGQTQIVNLTIK